MATIVINEPLMHVNITSAVDLSIMTTPVRPLLSAVETLNKVVPISSIQVTQTDGFTDQFVYVLTLKDGRIWNGRFLVPIPIGEFSSTFDVVDFWKRSEFEPSKEVRTHIVELLQNYGTTHINIQYT